MADAAHRTAGEDALRERLAGAFGPDALAASSFELLHDEPPVVAAQVGSVRASLIDGTWLVVTCCFENYEHLGLVHAGGRVEWLARTVISPPELN